MGYPVISFTHMMTYKGFKENLSSKNTEPSIAAYFPNEGQVTENTPPTFLFHATDDHAEPVENSIAFYMEKRCATVHIYPKADHGFSLALANPYLRGWTDRLLGWLDSLE